MPSDDVMPLRAVLKRVSAAFRWIRQVAQHHIRTHVRVGELVSVAPRLLICACRSRFFTSLQSPAGL